MTMSNLVREIAQDFHSNLRFSKDAIDAVHSAVEAFGIEMFEGAGKISNIARKQTLLSKHFRAVNPEIWKDVPVVGSQ